MKLKSSILGKIDWFLFLPMLVLISFGALSLFDPLEIHFFIRQLVWIGISVFVYLFLVNIDFAFLKNKKVVWFLLFLGFVILSSVLLLGEFVKGAQNRIYLFGFAIQPSEFVKIILIVVLAKYFAKRHMEITHFRHIVISFLYTFLFVVLLALQPDYGMAIIYLGIWAFMIFASGVSKKHIILLLFASFLSFALLWNYGLAEYQKQRIITFLNPVQDIYGSGYNVHQALIAIGSGGLLGKGVTFGSQSKLHFLPEYQTDFIFAAFAEEWGFVGIVFMFGAFIIILYRILKYSFYGESNFEKLFAVGVFAMIFIQAVIHIGMNLGLLPVTGLPLPFVSYGGSHLLTEVVSLAILNSMGRFAKFHSATKEVLTG